MYSVFRFYFNSKSKTDFLINIQLQKTRLYKKILVVYKYD